MTSTSKLTDLNQMLRCIPYRWIDEKWVKQTELTPYNLRCSEYVSKTSVDSGKFIPGEYRVNPYKVYRWYYEFKSRDSNCYSYATFGNTRFRYEIIGPIGALFVQPIVQSGFDVPTIAGNIEQRALQKAHGKILSNEVGMGENLGEIRETLELLRHPFKGLRDFLSNSNHKKLGLLNKLMHFRHSGVWVGKNDVLETVAAGKAAANAWLEVRYGLQPLMYTVQDIMKMVDKKISAFDADGIHSSVANVKLTNSVKATELYGSIWPASGVNSGPLVCEDKISAHASVQFRYNGTMTTAERLGLAPQYLPELAWELTRLSFVVDWWFSVGDWLASLRVKPGVQILGNTVGLKIDRTVSCWSELIYPGPIWYGYPAGSKLAGDVIGHRTFFERKVDVHLQLFPHFKLAYVNHLHTIDALALILQPMLNKIKR